MSDENGSFYDAVLVRTNEHELHDEYFLIQIIVVQATTAEEEEDQDENDSSDYYLHFRTGPVGTQGKVTTRRYSSRSEVIQDFKS